MDYQHYQPRADLLKDKIILLQVQAMVSAKFLPLPMLYMGQR